MIKAVFVDYTGTTVAQTGAEMDEIVRLVEEHSTMKSKRDVLTYFYQSRVDKEKESTFDSYVSEDEIIDIQLKELTEKYQFSLEHQRIKSLVHQFWKHTPVYEDAKRFFLSCPLPVYILTNNGAEFVYETMKYHGLACAGIISSDDVKAYKPRIEIFQKALEVSGCSCDEVIHVGDSYESDVLGALLAHIQPVWLQRDKKKSCDVMTISSFDELAAFLFNRNVLSEL